jgi:uncharacterized membrane protein
MPTNRLEAFSDGVFAIAITLLVLDLRVPQDPADGLGHALWFDLWPNYFAYVVSFVVIGIIWINHHAVVGAIGRADQTVLALNLLLLMTVVALPFTTSLVAEYLRDGGADARLAVAVYSAGMVLNAVSWTLLWRYVAHRPALLAAHVDPAAARASVRGFNLGLPIYALTVGVSFVNAYAGLVLHFVLALYYLRSPIRFEPDAAA